jgi:hypothetical protein
VRGFVGASGTGAKSTRREVSAVAIGIDWHSAYPAP